MEIQGMRGLTRLALLLAFTACASLLSAQTFQLHTLSPGLQTGGVDWGDYDADGDLDLVAGGLATGGTPTTYIYRNDGGTFTALALTLGGCMHGNVKWGDWDQDNDLDLVIAGSRGTYIYQNTGNGNFVLTSSSLPSVYMGNVDLADYDRDGDVDLLLSASDQGLVICQNNRGIFTPVLPALTSLEHGRAWWGDSDNDGDQDILLLADSSGHGINRLYVNTNGSFRGSNNPGYSGPYAHVSGNWADMTNDGFLDMIFSTNTGSTSTPLLRVMVNNHNNTFTQQNYLNEYGTENGFLATADFDADGYLDYMISGDSATTRLFELRRTINAQSTRLVANLGLLDNSWMAWGDYNGDHQPDMAFEGNTSSGELLTLGIYEQSNGHPNTVPLPPSQLTASVSGSAVTLHWTVSGTLDQQTPNAALTANLWVRNVVTGAWYIAPLANPSTGKRYVAARGNAGVSRSITLPHLPDGVYDWGVQMIDGAFEGSDFAEGATFAINPDEEYYVTTVNSATLCPQGSVELEVVPAASNYQWLLNGGPAPGAANQQTYQATAAGSYSCRVGPAYNIYTRNTVTLQSAASPGAPTVLAPPTGCDGQTMTATAIPGANGDNCAWYLAPSGGTPYSTGTSLSLSVSSPITFYVSTVNTAGGCESATRTPCTFNVYPAPGRAATTSPVQLCDVGMVTLSATPGTNGDNVNWYRQSHDMEPFYMGTSLQANVQAPVTYYLRTVKMATGCTSLENTVLQVTLTNVPGQPQVANTTICAPAAVTLVARPQGASSCRWYRSDTSATPLATGTSYTTPVLSRTTNVYVTSWDSVRGCESERQVVTVFVGAVHDAPLSEDVQGYGNTSLVLYALAPAGATTCKWYSDQACTHLLATGNSFLTPTLSRTTTYWVRGYDEHTQCDGPAVAVNAIISAAPSLSPNPDYIANIPQNYVQKSFQDVNLFSGDLNYSLSLASISGAMVSYSVSAMYNSRSVALSPQNTTNELAGMGWKLCDYPKVAYRASDQSYLLLMPGRTFPLHLESTSGTTQTMSAGDEFHLWRIQHLNATSDVSAQRWALTDENGQEYLMEGVPTNIAEGGMSTQVWNLTKLRDAQKLDSLTFAYSGRRLMAITSPYGEKLAFTYDNQGKLTTIDEYGLVTSSGSWIAGRTTLAYAQQGPRGNTRQILSSVLHATNQAEPGSSSLGWDAAAAPTTFTYDTTGYRWALIKVTEAIGAATGYTYGSVPINHVTWHPVTQVDLYNGNTHTYQGQPYHDHIPYALRYAGFVSGPGGFYGQYNEVTVSPGDEENLNPLRKKTTSFETNTGDAIFRDFDADDLSTDHVLSGSKSFKFDTDWNPLTLNNDRWLTSHTMTLNRATRVAAASTSSEWRGPTDSLKINFYCYDTHQTLDVQFFIDMYYYDVSGVMVKSDHQTFKMPDSLYGRWVNFSPMWAVPENATTFHFEVYGGNFSSDYDFYMDDLSVLGAGSITEGEVVYHFFNGEPADNLRHLPEEYRQRLDQEKIVGSQYSGFELGDKFDEWLTLHSGCKAKQSENQAYALTSYTGSYSLKMRACEDGDKSKITTTLSLPSGTDKLLIGFNYSNPLLAGLKFEVKANAGSASIDTTFTLASSYFVDLNFHYWQHVLTVPSGTHSASFSLEVTHDGSAEDVNEFYLDDLTFIYLQDQGSSSTMRPAIAVTDPALLGYNYHARVLSSTLHEIQSQEWIYEPMQVAGQGTWAGLVDTRASTRGASLQGNEVTWSSHGQSLNVAAAWSRERKDSASVNVRNKSALVYAWKLWPELAATGQNRLADVAMVVNYMKPDPAADWQVQGASVVQWKQFTGLSTGYGGRSSLWAPWRTFTLIGPATSDDIMAVSTHLADSHYTPPANLWQLQHTVTRVDGMGRIVEEVTGSGTQAVHLWSQHSYRDEANATLKREPQAYAHFMGAGAGNCFYAGFETYELPMSGVATSVGFAHTGTQCVVPSTSSSAFDYPFAFNSQGASSSTYVFGAWVMPLPHATQVRLTVKNVNNTIYKQQTFSNVTAGKWQYFEVVFPLTATTENLRFVIDNGANQSPGYVDDIRFSPGAAEFAAEVYDMVSYTLTAELDNDGRTWRNVYDRNGTASGYSAPDNQPVSVSTSFISARGGTAYNENKPNSAMEAMCRGTGTHFGWQDSYQAGQWATSMVTFLPGKATFTNSYMTLGAAYLPSNKSDWGLSFTLRSKTVSSPSTSGTQAFTVDFGGCSVQLVYGKTALTIKAKSGDTWSNVGSQTIALNGNSAIGTDVQVFFAGTNMLLWVNGELISNSVNTLTTPVTMLKLQGTSGTMFLSTDVTDLQLMNDPLIHVAFSDGLGNLIQDQTVVGNNLIVEELVYDNMMRAAIDTKTAMLTATRPGLNTGFVTSFDWGSGVLSGTVIAAGAYGDDPHNDQNYAYSRAVYYHQPDQSTAFLFNPGKDFALRDKTNWEKAKAWMYSDFPEFVSEAIEYGGYAFDIVNCIVEPEAAPLIIAMDVGGYVMQYIPWSSDNVAAEVPVTKVWYNSRREVQKITLPKANAKRNAKAAQATTFAYDFQGQLQTASFPESGTRNYCYDQWGQLRFSQTADNRSAGQIVYYKYDAKGRLIESGTIPGPWNTATLNAQAQQPNFPDANLATISNLFLYDGSEGDSIYHQHKRGYLTQRHTYNPDGYYTSEQFWYDDYGYVKGTQMTQHYTTGSSESYRMSYAYDFAGNTTKIIYPPYNGQNFIVTRAYDKQNQLIKVGTDTDPAAYASYSWNPDGSLQHTRIPRSTGAWYTQAQTYNAPGWLASILGRDSTSAHTTTQLSAVYDYNIVTDWWSRLWGEKYYNGSLASLDLSRYNYAGVYRDEKSGFTYDLHGRLDKYTDDGEELLISGYDSGSDNPFQDDYDLNGNLVQHLYSFPSGGTGDSLRYTYAYDSQRNTLLSVQRYQNWSRGTTYYHDWDSLKVTTSPAGYMTRLDYVSHTPSAASYRPVPGPVDSTSTRQFTYSPLGLLSSVSWSGTRQTSGNVQFYYDGQNDRIRKVATVGSTVTTTAYVRGLSTQPLMEVVKTGNTVTAKYYVMGTDGPVVMVSKSGSTTNSWVIMKDRAGSTVGLLNRATGARDAIYDYDSYGQLVPRGCVNPGLYTYLFAGQEYDAETRLYNFNARMYDPWLKMFTSPDAEHQDLGTPYAYCSWDPINRIDPSGNEDLLIPEILNATREERLAAENRYRGKSLNDMLKDPIRVNADGEEVDLRKVRKKRRAALRRPLQWRLEFYRRLNSFDPAVMTELRNMPHRGNSWRQFTNMLRPGEKHEFFQVSDMSNWVDRGMDLNDVQGFALNTVDTEFSAWDEDFKVRGQDGKMVTKPSWAHRIHHTGGGYGKGPKGRGRKFSSAKAHEEVRLLLLQVPVATTPEERIASKRLAYEVAGKWIRAEHETQIYKFSAQTEGPWLEKWGELRPAPETNLGKRGRTRPSGPPTKKPGTGN